MFKLSPTIVFLYIFGVVGIFMTGIYFHYQYGHRDSAISTARTYMTALRVVHKYYSEEIIPRAEANGAIFDPQYQDFDDRLPFPGTVAMELGRVLGDVDPTLGFNLYSQYPFQWNQDRILDPFEQASLLEFEDGQAEEFVSIEEKGGEDVVRLAVPVYMTASCVECHNRTEFEFERIWSVGELRGARQVSVPVHRLSGLPDNFLVFSFIATLLAGGVGIGLVWPMVRRLDRALVEKGKDMETLKSTEEKLRHAQKMETVGQLTSGVAHKFNNLLAVVQGNVELSKLEPTESTSHMDEILRATERGAALTRCLLAFSEKQTLDLRPVDLTEVVGNMSELFSQTLGKDIDIEIKFSDDLWRAQTDQSQLENALLNLILNARDAMPDGGKILISCENRPKLDQHATSSAKPLAGDYAALIVTDDGQGMSNSILERAIEPFFTSKDMSERSGLGLSTVHGFAQQSGGKLELKSQEGEGTTATLFLPRAIPATPTSTSC